jgi:hypothetical protein
VEQSSFAGTMWRKSIALSRMVEEQYGALLPKGRNGA